MMVINYAQYTQTRSNEKWEISDTESEMALNQAQKT